MLINIHTCTPAQTGACTRRNTRAHTHCSRRFWQVCQLLGVWCSLFVCDLTLQSCWDSTVNCKPLLATCSSSQRHFKIYRLIYSGKASTRCVHEPEETLGISVVPVQAPPGLGASSMGPSSNMLTQSSSRRPLFDPEVVISRCDGQLRACAGSSPLRPSKRFYASAGVSL